MATFFGKGHWVYWTILLAVFVAAGVVLVRRKSPEEVARTRSVWGDQALEAKKYEQAIAFYKVVIDKDPTLYSAYFNLALAYEFVDDEKALAAWEKYIEVTEGEPSQAEWREEARVHLGRARAAPHAARAAELFEAEKYEEARAEYEAALATDADNLELLRGAAANEAAAGDYAAAAAHYERALELAPYSMNVRYELGLTYEKLDKNKAVKLYEEMLGMSKTRTGATLEKMKDAQRRHAALRREGYRAD
jgi:tetratricopeptide (TPR) repeat protein